MKELLISFVSAFVAVMTYKTLIEHGSKMPENDAVADEETEHRKGGD